MTPDEIKALAEKWGKKFRTHDAGAFPFSLEDAIEGAVKEALAKASRESQKSEK